ncbi:L-threonine synthase [Nitrosomonas cryotolerans]|uniref:Threonine synthase n=1 Tax=Nitrosomonas cryotolerans ATCC 49181 TaxID=1131553 RepID=A0A1N6J7H5_9PROT|nr:threonine synthase [Nitrosomonas cryotolerans]SFP45186.1 L-threonine synthase [Nitrosomonas cryotolerans]SIO40056.1 L-threonine synthase [Nitrosomonas cryotolerans ATCC 49181]
MHYISTRGGMPPKSFSDILLSGLSPDGGLAIPELYPRIDAAELERWRKLSYQSLAFEILTRFIDDIPETDLRGIIERTYTPELFGNADITPLKTLEPGLHILGLSNGPTLAFKDIAMQLLGNLFEYALEKTGDALNILGATSGDTGSSAEYAMRGKQRIRVFMLSPLGKMSRFQTAQMFSLQDQNIFNIAIRGVFDDCQDIVKAVSNDHQFKQKYHIGTVNSINWARIVAQIIYYFKGYFAATHSNHEQVAFAVPSGNFGNICAGHVARMMGLPIKQLILATNENDVLDEFFRTGIYRPRATMETHHTSSPSMDISKASNFERFVFDLTERRADKVAELWRGVDRGEAFDLSATPFWDNIRRFGFVSGSSHHAARIATIRKFYQQYNVIVDPHTADGLKVGLEHRETDIPLICLETAQPAKFSESIVEAIGCEPDCPAGYDNLENLSQRYDVKDVDISAIKAYIAERCE